MKNLKASLLMLGISNAAMAGGISGGGGGLLVESEVYNLKLMDNFITNEVFETMIIVGQEGDPLIINGYEATVQAVDLEKESVDVNFTDANLTVTLQAVD